MVSQRKQIANRLNAAKSTGPRSAEGKRASAQNRLKHGFYSADVVLPGEDRADYHVLLDALVAEHRPQTATQMLCVQRVASCTWKLRRLEASHARAHERQQRLIEHEVQKEVEAAQLALARHVSLDCLAMSGSERTRGSAGARRRRRARLALDDHEADAESPAAPDATLARSVRDSAGGEFERLGRYEQRLQNMIHRALAELRKLREEHAAIQEQPESPFTRELDERDDDTECNDAADVRNEPTIKRGDWPPPPAMDPDPTPRQAYAAEFLRNEATGEQEEASKERSGSRPASG